MREDALLAELLAAERAAPPVDVGVRAALRDRLAAGIALAPPTPSSDQGPAAQDPGAAGGSASAAAAATGVAKAVGAGAVAKAGLLGGSGVIAAAAFAAGIATGAGGHALLQRDPPPTAPSPSAAPAPEPATEPEPEPEPAPIAATAAPEPRPSRRRTPAPRAADQAVAHERELLEAARTALGRGQAADALRQLGAHIARFPDGRLVEEREALRVQALVAAGDCPHAHAAAAAFARRFPDSLFARSVTEALERLP